MTYYDVIVSTSNHNLPQQDRVEAVFGEVLEQTGHWTKWHLVMFVGVAIVGMQDAGNMMWPIFGSAHLPHRCRIPGIHSLQNEHNVSQATIKHIFYNDPKGYGCKAYTKENGCTALNADPAELIEEAAGLGVEVNDLLEGGGLHSAVVNRSEYVKCTEIGHGWEFMPGDVENSIVSEFDLVCEREIYRRVDKSLFVLGQCVGALLLANLSDVFGRKLTLLVQFGIETVFIVGMCFCHHPVTLIVLRFFVSVFNMAKFPIATTFAAEIMLPKNRTVVGMMPGVMFGVGCFIYAVIGYFVRTWRLYTSSGMWFCPVVSLYWIFLMPESPRWLLRRGRISEFKRVIKRMECLNGQTISANTWDKIHELQRLSTQTQDTCKEKVKMVLQYYLSLVTCRSNEESGYSPLDVLRQPLLRRWMILFGVVWSCNMLLYYSLLMGQDLFQLDLHSFTLLSSAFEVPGVLWATVCIVWIGRKKTMMVGLLLCGICVTIAKVFDHISAVVLVFASLSRLFVTGTFDMAFLYTSETMPTLMRGTGVGICSCVCRFLGMVFPYIDTLNSYWHGASSVALVFFCLLAVACCFGLPETKGQYLPETIEDCQLLRKGLLKKRYIDKQQNIAFGGNVGHLPANNASDSNELAAVGMNGVCLAAQTDNKQQDVSSV